MDSVFHVFSFQSGSSILMLLSSYLLDDGYQDYNVTDTVMHVIWAIGQTADLTFHRPFSSLEANESTVTDFYRPDEVKYHGTRNRGATQINFFCKFFTNTFLWPRPNYLKKL